MGRPRTHTSNADRQRAYRDRQRQKAELRNVSRRYVTEADCWSITALDKLSELGGRYGSKALELANAALADELKRRHLIVQERG